MKKEKSQLQEILDLFLNLVDPTMPLPTREEHNRIREVRIGLISNDINIDDLVKDYHESQMEIVNIWSIQDVYTRAEDMFLEVTESEAWEILQRVKRYFDAEVGISWDSIDQAIDEHFREKTQ